jgi:hypothetical protein
MPEVFFTTLKYAAAFTLGGFCVVLYICFNSIEFFIDNRQSDADEEEDEVYRAIAQEADIPDKEDEDDYK